MKVQKFRKKPIVIEALKYTEDNYNEVYKFLKKPNEGAIGSWIIIETLEGDMKCFVGDYIIKGIKGEFYPCKPDIFEQTYEPVI